VSDKQIFAALEIADHEVRLIVGEFFNTRFNIIKTERTPVAGMEYDKVTNPKAIVEAINKAAANASKTIGAKIERVILCIPAYNMRRYSLKVTVPIEGIDQTVTVEDIRKCIKKAMATNIGKNYALIQTVCVKYTVNGITSRRIPLGEKCTELTADIDLLCADRKLAFDLVNCIEATGLKVLDICLDMFGVAKEAALFEQAVDQNVIEIKMERTCTTLALLEKGRLKACDVFPLGVGTIAGALVEKYSLPGETAAQLVKYNARLNQKVYSDNAIYIWAAGQDTHTLSEEELVKAIGPKVAEWLETVSTLSKPILQAGSTAVIITGEGGEMQGLNELLQQKLGTDVRNYIPETLGGRYSGLTACLGLFYAYKDQLPITGFEANSLNMEQFMKTVSYKEKKDGEQEETITKKLKGMLFDAKK
jgi:cell division protein FtsA